MSLSTEGTGQGYPPVHPAVQPNTEQAGGAAQPFPQAALGLPENPFGALLSGIAPPQLPTGGPAAQHQPHITHNTSGADLGTVLKQEPVGGAANDPMQGQAGPFEDFGLGSAAGSGDAADAVAPSDPNDPEAVAAVLSTRMAAAGASIIFEKPLTASDVSGGGRVVVPKSVAEQYFPKLEQPSGVTISASDLDGRTYTFKWRFWVNNSSRMYLLEGAGELHRNYGLEVGDVMVFAQKPDGSLVVAGRMASKSDLVKRPPFKRSVATNSGGFAQASRGKAGGDLRAARGTPLRVMDAASSGAGSVAAATAAAIGPAGGSPAAAGFADSGARGRKRKASVPAPSLVDVRLRGRGEEGVSPLAVLDMEAPSDGVFRAVVMQHVTPVPLGVALARNNRWTATLEVAGEVYQAFFDNREDALEAVTAAGASP